MFQEIPVNQEKIFAFRVTGKLTHADYQAFLPRLEALIEGDRRISLLVEFDGFRGWDLEAARDDFKFARAHPDAFERIAMVGENRWQRWMAVMAKPFIDGEVRYFAHDDIQAAWDWLHQPGEGSQPQKLLDPDPFSHILMATDFSAGAERAARRALELAGRYAARLTVLHVVEHTVLYDDAYDPIIPNCLELDQQLREIAKQRMTQLLQDIAASIDVRSDVQFGTPRRVVLSYAAAQGVDLIVVGRHGRSGLSRLMGSTANALVHKAHCEVLMVPVDV
jgi:universal stress protein A